MKCMNCSVLIPPEWKKVILSNVCPNCDKEIMNEKGKELLNELKDAMEKMPNDAGGICGWLLSNYQLIKIGDAQPVNRFHDGQINNSMPNTIGGNIDNGKTHQAFLERALPGFVQKAPENKPQTEASALKAAAAKIISQNFDAYGDEENQEIDEPAIVEPEAPPPSILIGEGIPINGSEAKLLNHIVAENTIGNENSLYANQQRLQKLQRQAGITKKPASTKNSFWRG